MQGREEGMWVSCEVKGKFKKKCCTLKTSACRPVAPERTNEISDSGNVSCRSSVRGRLLSPLDKGT